MAKEVIVTLEGMKKLQNELETLKGRRNEIAEKIKQARDFGDLSENSEYDEAKNEQGQVEVRIAQLENMLKNIQVVDDDDINTEYVSVGTKVALENLENGATVSYTIVGSTEANPREKKISNESPVGSALIGKAVGEEVVVTTPGGDMRFKVVDIQK